MSLSLSLSLNIVATEVFFLPESCEEQSAKREGKRSRKQHRGMYFKKGSLVPGTSSGGTPRVVPLTVVYVVVLSDSAKKLLQLTWEVCAQGTK